ncbi:MAG: hypothetical protein R2710_11515 [Acidimicrobiales bacterium]
MSYQLGIDLGTTFTAAAIADGAGVRMADLTHDSVAIPSVLTRTSDGIAVGAEPCRWRRPPSWLVARVQNDDSVTTPRSSSATIGGRRRS